MSEEKEKKLNRLQHDLPEGLLVNAAWLEGRGYSASLRNRYLGSGWLEQPTRGVYRRPGGHLLWQHVVISLQTLLLETGVPALVVGGRTALELQGFAHYLSSGTPKEVHLHGDKRPPSWLSKLKLDTRFIFHNTRRLFREEPIAFGIGSLSWNIQDRQSFNNDPLHGSGFTRQTWGQWDWPLTLTSPERAILELLDEVPKRETFHQADMLMEGLSNLSPNRLQKLLMDCRSVKVKRLFLWFSERHNHAWFKRLELSGVDLGKGKRQIVRGGRYDSKYKITVPEDLDADR
jgi:hypothetical protein